KRISTVSLPTAAQPRGRSSDDRPRLAVMKRMPGDYLTCMATSISGARIGTTRITTRIAGNTTLWVLKTVKAASCAAGLGTPELGFAGQPAVTPTSPNPANPTAVFGWSCGSVRRLPKDNPSQGGLPYGRGLGLE